MTDLLNASSAAELLGVDKRTVLRFARAGKIRSYRTPGGQHRFWREDVERLRAGDSSSGDSRPSVSTVQTKHDEVESLNLDVQARRAQRELRRIETEDAEAERKENDARRAEALANRRALAAIRAGQERERREAEIARANEAKEREAARAREAAERQRRAWEAQTVVDALASLPRDVPPDVRATASESLRQALAPLGPSDAPQFVEIAISGAIAKALAPWRSRKEIEQAIEGAESSLPARARSLWSPGTEWQIRFRAAADAAIRALPADVPIGQVRAAVHAEARKIATEFERGEAEERHRQTRSDVLESGSMFAALLDVNREERDASKQAAKRALGKLPIGATRAELEEARDAALAPFRARKKAGDDVDRYLEHVAAYIEKLGAPDGEWDLGDYFERCRFAEQLKKQIRPVLTGAIVVGEIENADDAKDFIEDAVDAELEDE